MKEVSHILMLMRRLVMRLRPADDVTPPFPPNLGLSLMAPLGPR